MGRSDPIEDDCVTNRVFGVPGALDLATDWSIPWHSSTYFSLFQLSRAAWGMILRAVRWQYVLVRARVTRRDVDRRRDLDQIIPFTEVYCSPGTYFVQRALSRLSLNSCAWVICIWMRLEHHPGSSWVAVCHHANFHCPCFERVYQDTLGFDDNCWVAKQWSVHAHARSVQWQTTEEDRRGISDW